MKNVKISLNSIDKVKSFVNTIARYDLDFDLVSGRYVIDAKSIMGIFSLDLSKPIDLNIHGDAGIDGLAGCGKVHLFAFKNNLPFGWGIDTGHNFDQRGFSGTVFSYQSVALTRVEIDGNICECFYARKYFADVFYL